MADEPKFDADGALVIPAARLGRLAEQKADRLRLVRLLDDLLVCARSQPGQRSQPLFYGDLRLFHVGELLALIAAMRKDGQLHLLVPHARKTIQFVEGEVVHASSTVEDDRLGEVLWRRGMLSLEQLSAVQDQVRPGVKLGRLLIERGLLTPRQLYDGLREQVVEIVYSTFHLLRGEFLFIEGQARRKGTVQLETSTQELIREGVRRVQELTRLEEVLPHGQAVLAVRPVQLDLQPAERERRLLDLIDGRRTAAEIIAASHLGEFEARKVLAGLVTGGQVEVCARSAGRGRPAGKTPDVLHGQARLIRRIHQTLALEAPAAVGRLAEYLASPGARHTAVFKGVALDGEGRLDIDTLLRNARRLDADHAGRRAAAALRAFYDYAVFQAMDVLEDAECDALLERLDAERAALEG